MSDDDLRVRAYDPTRIYENRPECTHVDSVQKKTAPPPPPPDLPEASFGPLARPMRTDVSGIRRTAANDPPARSEIQTRLDAFRAAATPSFRAEGKDVPVRIPFRMTIPAGWANDPRHAASPWAVQERGVQANEAELQEAASSARLTATDVRRLHEGRATPEQIRAVTQALIDAGHLPDPSPSAPDLPMRIRKMMLEHGIGLDCAGYTQQAYLASRGLPRSASEFEPNIENENLANLSRKGFARVSLNDARPGDLLILNPPTDAEPGHTLIVYERRAATEEETADLRARGFEGRIEAFVLDSSYGSEARFDAGGVMQQLWLRDQKGNWARKMVASSPDGRKDHELYDVSRPARGAEQVYGPPYHSVEGLYRPRGEAR